LVLIFLGMLAGAAAYYMIFGPNVKVDKAVVEIPPGTGLNELTATLKPYLHHTVGFRLTARLKKFTKPRPGRYLLRKDMSNNELINMLRSGRQLPVDLTFNNIPTLEALAGKVSQVLAPDSLALLKSMKDREFLKKHGFTPETALLMYVPNTYRFHYFTSPEAFRERMWKEYQKFWNDERRQKAEQLGLTPVEVGILASIVQKETNLPDEKGRIARVYLNRLRKGMLLQADPTVVYAYRQATGDTTVIKRVLKKHLQTDNPYNTYKYKGLPPGPITMPDISTIDAVLNAPRHDYLYFSADPNRPGHHLFARTLREHLNNARSYHRHLNERKIFQ